MPPCKPTNCLEDNEMKITLDKIETSNSRNDNNNSGNNSNINITNKRISKEDISTIDSCIKILKEHCPKILNIFEIKELIGSGSESKVYKVIYKNTNKEFAMKLISLENKEKPNMIELSISNKFKHKNITMFYGFYEIKKKELECIVMEYAKFGNLRDFQKNVLKRNEISEQLLCYLAFHILNGLNYCHKCKVTHFDIKPQNIIINEFLEVKLIDFSVSVNYSLIKSKKIKLPFRGTNFYMAPEVIKSKTVNVKDLNKIDLYSFGVILYSLAFGNYPYGLNSEDSKDYDKIYYKIQNNKLEFKNDDNYFSKYFIDFLEKLLEKDINKRININQALNHYWIKGGNILNDEKEKTFNTANFLINLITDHYMNFDNYIKN